MTYQRQAGAHKGPQRPRYYCVAGMTEYQPPRSSPSSPCRVLFNYLASEKYVAATRHKCRDVIPAQRFSEIGVGKDRKHDKRNHFLNRLE